MKLIAPLFAFFACFPFQAQTRRIARLGETWRSAGLAGVCGIFRRGGESLPARGLRWVVCLRRSKALRGPGLSVERNTELIGWAYSRYGF